MVPEPSEASVEEKPSEEQVQQTLMRVESDDPAVEVEQLREQLNGMETQLSTAREQVLRLAADFENYKRRQQQAVDDDKFQARREVVSSMLPLLDNLQRAVDAAEQGGDGRALTEGVKLVLRQLGEILAKQGLSEIESDGKPFDPNLHEAVISEERDDVEDQTILETLQKGYKLGTRTLRPSLVKVARSSN